MNKSMKKTRILAVTAMLSAISILLSYLEIGIPGYLKLDFSLFPALIGTFTMGPLSGMATVIVTQLVQLIGSDSTGIGQLANVLMGCSLVGFSGLIYQIKKTRKTAVTGMLAGTVLMAVVAAFANYYIMLPFYENLFPIEVVVDMIHGFIPAVNTKLDIILFYVIPFNLIKGGLVSLVTFFVYKPLSPVIHGRI